MQLSQWSCGYVEDSAFVPARAKGVPRCWWVKGKIWEGLARKAKERSKQDDDLLFGFGKSLMHVL